MEYERSSAASAIFRHRFIGSFCCDPPSHGWKVTRESGTLTLVVQKALPRDAHHGAPHLQFTINYRSHPFFCILFSLHLYFSYFSTAAEHAQ